MSEFALELTFGEAATASGYQGPEVRPGADMGAVWTAPALFPRMRRSDVAMISLAAEGLNDKAIARLVGIPDAAIHHRWRLVRDMLGANDRAHAVAIALSLGLIKPPARAVSLMALLPTEG